MPGFVQCGVCGGGMVVGSQDCKGRARRPVYACGCLRERGNAVCANRLVVPIEIADRSVLTALRADSMRPEVVEAAEARQILQEMLVGRLIFTPEIGGSARYYTFTGRATLSGPLAGVIPSESFVTPAGFASPGVLQARGIVRAA